MQISSNSLFHFTSSNVLKKILQNSTISGSYCREQIIYSDSGNNTIIVPMICFCDIPLKTYCQLQTQTYGNFGIGLKKSWGINNQLNPVLYIDSNSTVAEKFQDAIDGIADLSENVFERSRELRNSEGPNLLNETLDLYKTNQPQSIDKIQEIINKKEEYIKKLKYQKKQNEIPKLFLHLIEFTKPYQGDLVRGDKTIPNYRYYDEMEWRFVPKREELEPTFKITDIEQFDEWRNKNERKPLMFSLRFELSDIDYVVVEKNDDVEDFTTFFQEMNEIQFSSEQKNDLCSKIVSTESSKKKKNQT